MPAKSANFLSGNFVSPIHKLHVRDWMTANPEALTAEHTLQEAAELLLSRQIDGVPIIDGNRIVTGLLTKTRLVRCFAERIVPTAKIGDIVSGGVKTIGWNETLEKAYQIPVGRLPAVDEEGRLVGILTRSDILHAYSRMLEHLPDSVYSAEFLKTVIESAYEGIVVVDREGTVREINEAYCRFIGKRREDVLNRHVTEVIENTLLHVTVKTGIPERGVVQRIQGQDMIVHRIPIWKNGEIAGGIGMLIFEGVSELYGILERIQSLSMKTKEQPASPDRRPAADTGAAVGRFDRMIGKSPEMLSIKQLAKRAAATQSTILITGESGTGKELFARAIHSASSRVDGPFVGINCAAIPEHLLEAELFGYEEGAFTGARKGGKPGKFDLADKGTLFLDEIGEMPPVMQSKMLRVLQERVVERVGGISGKAVDVRIVAATNADIETMVKQGTFREDLYYRLNIIRIHIPALRERKQDIPLLLTHHLQEFCRRFGMMPKQFSPEVVGQLMQYDWPGNIRELVNTVEMLVSLTDGLEITARDLPARFRQQPEPSAALADTDLRMPAEMPAFSGGEYAALAVARMQALDREKEILIRTLAEVNGNKSAAAKKLNIHRSTLYEKLKSYGLSDR